MSEFSESYHLRTTDKNEAKALLKTLGIRGVVYEPTNGWVTVLPEGDLNSQIMNMASAYQGIVLHYMFAEDHAWMMNLFSGGELKSRFLCAWDPDLHIDDSALNIEALVPYLLAPDTEPELEALFALNGFESIFKMKPAYTFADLLGIENYDWISGHYYETHAKEFVEQREGAELVE